MDRHAYYSKEDYENAIKAFEDGLQIDPNNSNLKTNLENAKARLPAVARSTSPAARELHPFPLFSLGKSLKTTPIIAGGAGGMPDLSSLAGMFGGGGGGGMPDLASMMQNPQIMQMAQQMMANGGMERLMSNPALRNMVCDDSRFEDGTILIIFFLVLYE